MSTVTISDTPFVGNDRLLVGIVLSVFNLLAVRPVGD